MSHRDTERMITYRVKGGYSERESRELLAELLRAHAGDNLNHALAYDGFIR